MPNHLHFVCFDDGGTKSLNRIVGNLKRFWAYEIVKRLNKINDVATIEILQEGVQYNEKVKGKKHQVFRLSLDAKECFNQKMLE